jgi:hypothetical protein
MPPRHRVLMIRQGYLKAKIIRCFVVHSLERSPAIRQFDIEDYRELTSLNTSEPSDGGRTQSPLFLVCVHGERDKCCAKFGLPVFHDVRERVGHDVWQCSHVGGDRFAANVLWFPYGLYYGHVSSEDVHPLLDACLERKVHLKNLRGRSCHLRQAQAGEYFVRMKSGVMGVAQLNLLDAERLSPDRWRTRFSESGRTYSVEMRCVESHSKEYLSCRADEPRSVTQYELVDYSESL